MRKEKSVVENGNVTITTTKHYYDDSEFVRKVETVKVDQKFWHGTNRKCKLGETRETRTYYPNTDKLESVRIKKTGCKEEFKHYTIDGQDDTEEFLHKEKVLAELKKQAGKKLTKRQENGTADSKRPLLNRADVVKAELKTRFAEQKDKIADHLIKDNPSDYAY